MRRDGVPAGQDPGDADHHEGAAAPRCGVVAGPAGSGAGDRSGLGGPGTHASRDRLRDRLRDRGLRTPGTARCGPRAERPGAAPVPTVRRPGRAGPDQRARAARAGPRPGRSPPPPPQPSASASPPAGPGARLRGGQRSSTGVPDGRARSGSPRCTRAGRTAVPRRPSATPIAPAVGSERSGPPSLRPTVVPPTRTDRTNGSLHPGSSPGRRTGPAPRRRRPGSGGAGFSRWAARGRPGAPRPAHRRRRARRHGSRPGAARPAPRRSAHRTCSAARPACPAGSPPAPRRTGSGPWGSASPPGC